MRRAGLLAAFTVCAILAGCDEKKEHAPTSEPTGMAAAPGRPGLGAPGTATTTTTTAATTMTVGVADQDIPVEADFEEEAERDIVPGNMEAELTKIEKELAGEGTTEGGTLPGGRPGGGR
jgi:hypothetical protein